MKDITVNEAVKRLQKALKEDKEFRQSYVSNIAMCMLDELSQHENSNEGVVSLTEKVNKGAERFIDLFLS